MRDRYLPLVDRAADRDELDDVFAMGSEDIDNGRATSSRFMIARASSSMYATTAAAISTPGS
jgi:hypothetical protein